MKKIILLSFCSIILTAMSCNQKVEAPKSTSKEAAGYLLSKIIYMKDTVTGLCFAVTGPGMSESIHEASTVACVPCDSLKKVGVYEF